MMGTIVRDIPVDVLGRLWGNASGWDQVAEQVIYFYDFEPAPGVPLPKGSGIAFCFDRGFVETYDDTTGEVNWSSDLVPIAASLPPLTL
jgi:hypothetical protein